MKIHYFQHVPFEELGYIRDWGKQPGNRLTATRFYEDQRLPFIDICDFLIVLGGPMAVNDDKKFPWLINEKKFIEKAINAGKKVLGICLGAQLIADVLGAKVYPNSQKEIGWFPVEFTEEGITHPLFASFPEKETVFHWHGDTFDLPSGAVHVARSAACENQAFAYGNQVVGLQFHLEMRDADILKLIENCRNDLTDASFIQKEEDLKETKYMSSSYALLIQLLENLRNA